MEKQQSEKFKRQRRFFMVLPLMALPFITLLFWSLGGGQAQGANDDSGQQKGFNMALPDARLKKEEGLDKMSYYDQAMADSAKLKELMKNDPYYGSTPDTGVIRPADTALPSPAMQGSGVSTGGYSDPNEAKVYQKIGQLKAALDRESAMEAPTTQQAERHAPATDDAALDRLEQMMQSVKQPGAPDPEMEQLNVMMERILDIQHPERVQDKLRQTSLEKRGQVFPVTTQSKEQPITFLGSGTAAGSTLAATLERPQQNGFYSFDAPRAPTDTANAIEAVVHETQTLVNGSTVKLRLLNDIYINGVRIPKEQFVFGIAALDGERLNIAINSIRYLNSLFPVALAVHDMDGLNGIYIPGAIGRDVSKQSADRSLQNIGITSVDPSWQMQAAGAGVEAAKTLFSKKVKLVRVTVKAGYRVLLRDDKQRQNN